MIMSTAIATARTSFFPTLIMGLIKTISVMHMGLERSEIKIGTVETAGQILGLISAAIGKSHYFSPVHPYAQSRSRSEHIMQEREPTLIAIFFH